MPDNYEITKLSPLQISEGITTDNTPMSKRVDFVNDSLLYKGEAIVGSLESEAKWRIRKISFGVDGDITETYADGNSNFDNVWNDRLGLEYL